MGIVKLKLVIKAISAGVLPNRSQVLYGSIFWKDGNCPCLEGEIQPFSFFYSLEMRDCLNLTVSLSEKKQICVF